MRYFVLFMVALLSTFSVYARLGDSYQGSTKRFGKALNYFKDKYAEVGLVSVDQPNVVIETIKQAVDDDGLIVRLYESQRCRGPVTLRVGFPLAEAWETNLLEEDQAVVEINEDGTLTLPLRPFQIVTLRLVGG